MAELQRAWLFANGPLDRLQEMEPWIEAGDLLVAVDGGSRHLAKLKRIPDLLIGDLDSIAPSLRNRYQRRGVRILQYPVEKDQTDLELAVDEVIRQGCGVIRILGGLGGRLDHTLGNLALLTHPRYRNQDIRLVDARQEVRVIWEVAEITGQAGDWLSLLPANGDAQGVWTEGLYYPLHHETLYATQTRGVSNLLLGERARVGLSDGQLWCVHLRSPKHA